MAVITLDLVSGYIPLKDDLKDIVKNSPGVVKRYEVDGSEVSFYIEEFAGGQEVCLRMRVVRVVNVDGAKPGSVTVYDYYQPELSVSKVSVYMCLYLSSFSIHGLSYIYVVLSPYLYLSSFSFSLCTFFTIIISFFRSY